MKPAGIATVAAVIALAAGVAGFVIGRSSAPHRPAVRPAAAEASAARPEKPARPALAPQELDGLRKELDRQADPIERFKTATRHLEAWIESAPQDALAWLMTQEATSRRDEVIRMALAQFAETDPKGAAEWTLAHLQGADLNNTLLGIAETWASQNGREAAEWFASQPPGKIRDGAIEHLVFQWACDDPVAALAYLKDRPAAEALSPTLRRAAYAGWAKTDPQGAAAASLESSRVHGDPEQFANTLANWATMDANASSRWLKENVTRDSERLPAIVQLAEIYPHQSPAAGRAWLDSLSPAEKAAAIHPFAAAWAESDAPSAAAWLAETNPQGLAPEAGAAILHGFFSKDSDAYFKWRDSLPEGPLKTQAAQIGVAGRDD